MAGMPIESSQPEEASQGKQLALVIGVNQTNSPGLEPLHVAIADAQAMAQVLQDSCGFEMYVPPLLGEQATSDAIRKAIRKLARDRTDDDFLLLYFAGHAQLIQVDAGQSAVYLGSSDFDAGDVTYEDGNVIAYEEDAHISFRWLRERLFEETRAGRVLLILDCCNAGNMGRTAPDQYLKELQQRIAYYFEAPGSESRAHPGLHLALTATGYNQRAKEGDTHGLMTGFLLSALRGEVVDVLEVEQEGALSLQRLHRYLEIVMPATQRPSLSGDYASRSCILARYPELAANVRRALLHVAGAEHPTTYIPFPRDPLFQPRPGEFERLEPLLLGTDSTQHAVRVGLVGVTGMGGVGKTQLAVEVAYRFLDQQRFPAGIFWTPAFGTSRAEWQHHLAELAFQSGYLPPDDDPTNAENEARRARHLARYLASHADALLILDNVDDPLLINVFLPSFAGKELACAQFYTSRVTQAPPGVTLHAVERLPEPAALRLLLQTTRPALLTEMLAGSPSNEADAARRVCEIAGYLPLALVHLRGYLAQDRSVSLVRLVEVLEERGIMSIAKALTATFQLSWERVRTEEARRLFQLAAYFPEAAPIPLWLLGLATGLGEEGDIFEPLGQARLHVQELSLLEELSGQQVRLHPLVRAFGRHLLQHEGEKDHILRIQAVERLTATFCNLTFLEQRARQIGYHVCLEQVRATRNYARELDVTHADQLIRLERMMDRESYVLMNERWWPEILPGLFYQQLFNRAVETGGMFSSQQSPECWIHQMGSAGTTDQAPLRILAGHTDSVNSVAFSPDGRLVLTGSGDQTARLWDSSMGQQQATLHGHTSLVDSVAFSPDGHLVLTGSDDQTARLWDCGTGQQQATLHGHTNSVNSVAFSPDGQLVLTGSGDQTAQLWESSNGHLHATLQGHTSLVSSVAFSPDGRLVLTGSDDQMARLWESSTGQLRATLQGHTGLVSSVTFSLDGWFVLTGSYDQTARLWESGTGQLHAILHGHTSLVSSVAFSPDGWLVLTGSSDWTARLWESITGQLRATLHGHTGSVDSVAFSPDGRLVLTGSRDKTARLWESSTGQLHAILHGHTSRVISSVAFSPDGQFVLTSDSSGRTFFWHLQGMGRPRLLSLYVTADGVSSLFWQDTTHLLLADKGAGSGRPFIYQLHLEGSCWQEDE